MAYATRIAPAELPAQVPANHTGQNTKKTRVYQATTFAQNPHGQFRHRIIIGVDFGTTYSAIAWGTSSDPGRVFRSSNILYTGLYNGGMLTFAKWYRFH